MPPFYAKTNLPSMRRQRTDDSSTRRGDTREKRVANGLPLDLITGKMQKRLESDVSSKIHKEEYYDS